MAIVSLNRERMNEKSQLEHVRIVFGMTNHHLGRSYGVHLESPSRNYRLNCRQFKQVYVDTAGRSVLMVKRNASVKLMVVSNAMHGVPAPNCVSGLVKECRKVVCSHLTQISCFSFCCQSPFDTVDHSGKWQYIDSTEAVGIQR